MPCKSVQFAFASAHRHSGVSFWTQQLSVRPYDLTSSLFALLLLWASKKKTIWEDVLPSWSKLIKVAEQYTEGRHKEFITRLTSLHTGLQACSLVGSWFWRSSWSQQCTHAQLAPPTLATLPHWLWVCLWLWTSWLLLPTLVGGSAPSGCWALPSSSTATGTQPGSTCLEVWSC